MPYIPAFGYCRLTGIFQPLSRMSKKVIFNPPDFQEIYNRMLTLQPNSQRRWGKMNVVQMLNHLKIATGSGLHIYQLEDERSYFSRVVVRYVALKFLKRFPKNAKGPEGFKKELNDILDFNAEKAQVLDILQKAHTSTYMIHPHPMFGTMPKALWGRLIYRHFDHHLRQFSA